MSAGHVEYATGAKPDRWLIALGAAFLVLAAASVGYLVLISGPQSRAEALDDWESRLVAMANDRQVAIERWLADLTSVARTLSRYPTARYVLSGQSGPPYPFDPGIGAEEHLGELFDGVVEVHDYSDVLLFGTTGDVVARSAHPAPSVGGVVDSLAADAVAAAPGVRLSPGNPALVAASEPVRDADGAVVGTVVIVTEAEPFLYALLRQLPVPSRTGETILMTRREGVWAYVSPLRKVDVASGDVSAVVNSIPLGDTATDSDAVRYIDYARSEVLAAVRPIDGAPWTLAAKVDVEEALADYRASLATIVAAIAGLLVGALGLVFGIWRWQHQRLASTVLREKARFYALLDQANDPILFLDAEGRILDANRRAIEFYGFPRAELVGRPGELLRAEEDRARARDHLKTALARGTAMVDAEHVRASGETVPVEISTRRVELEDGTALISIVRDLSERKAAEEALRKTEERYRTLVESLPDLIARFDRDLRCQFVSSPGDGGSPFQVDDPEGRPLAELGLPAAMASELGSALRAAFGTGELQELEVAPPVTGDGRSFDWRVVPEHDRDGAVTSAIVLVRETTERYALEHQLRQAQKMEAVGRLAGGVAHDFNNIITSIQGHATLLLDELSDDHEEAGDLEEIVRSAERAASLTRQLLAFSRRQIIEPRKVDLGDSVLGLASMLRRVIGENIELDVSVKPDGDHTTLADPSQIEQVVVNLVVNARDAMPDGGRLGIQVSTVDWTGDAPDLQDATGRAVRLTVEDSGVGMDADTVERIFEPFFTTKEAAKGTGLGLSTVYGIVDQTGGSIEVDSAPGEGTRVEVLFPEVSPPGTEHEPADFEENAVAAPTRATILLVEDEAGVRALAERVLENEGYRVVTARSGDDALAVLEGLEEQPRLLITDMVMPGIDGRELAARIREECPGCSTLLMSGYTEDIVIREQALDTGTSFLAKPFTPAELTRRVAEALADGGPDGS